MAKERAFFHLNPRSAGSLPPGSPGRLRRAPAIFCVSRISATEGHRAGHGLERRMGPMKGPPLGETPELILPEARVGGPKIREATDASGYEIPK
jgi:hypothetical protein